MNSSRKRSSSRQGIDFFSDYFHYTRGHFYDSHPPIGPLLALPVYALPAWIGIPARPELVANLFSKLAASIIAALSAVAVFAASKRFGRGVDSERSYRATARLQSRMRWEHRSGPRQAWRCGRTRRRYLGYAVALWALTAGRPVDRRNGGGGRGLCQTGDRSRCRAARDVSGSSDALRQNTCEGSPSLLCRQASPPVSPGCSTTTGCSEICVGGAPFRTAIWMEEFGTTDMFSGSLPVGLRRSHCQPEPRAADLFSGRRRRDGRRLAEGRGDRRRRTDARACLRGTRASRRLRFF